MTADLFVQTRHELVAIVFGPVRKGRGGTHQFVLIPSGHLAKSRIHITDTAVHVQSTHPGEHGVFHSPAKIGFSDQSLLRFHAAAGMAPVANQHPGGHHTQCANQPKQAAAHHPLGGTPGLCAQDQAIAHGGNGHFIFVFFAPRPGLQAPNLCAFGHRLTCNHLPLAV